MKTKTSTPNKATIKPQTRGECETSLRPCPFVGCKFNLYLEIDPETGEITLNFPDIEPDEMKSSCALDIADQGGVPPERVGNLLNETRDKVQRIETIALRKLKPCLVMDSQGELELVPLIQNNSKKKKRR